MKSKQNRESTEGLVRRFARAGRVFTDTQLATRYADSKRPLVAARKTVERAKQKQLVTTEWAVLHPILELDSPLAEWKVDAAAPNFERIGYAAQSRWKRQPLRTLVVTPTVAGDGTGRTVRARELLHDIHVTELGLEFGDAFTHEDRFDEITWRFDFRPDGIVSVDGETIAVDFCGRYSAEKIARIHTNYSAAGVPYRLY